MAQVGTPIEHQMSSEGRLSIDAKALKTGYGKKQVLSGVSIGLLHGEIVALIGHNGAGKSTLLKALFGLLPLWEGQIFLDGRTLEAPNPRNLLRAGVVYVPQGNRVFTDLTVRENLEVGSIVLRPPARLGGTIQHAMDLFPALQARLHHKAGTLSGGEKQMLSLARALILSPRFLLLDEPSLGLAPPFVSEVLGRLQRVSCDSGVGILIVEQKVREVLKIAQRVYVLRNGQVSFSGPTKALDDDQLRRAYF